MEPIQPKYARRKFTAHRDGAGVPHVEAASWREAVYALGYMHAVDRPTQVLFSRTIASGRAAEQIADSAELLETDRFFRKAGLYRSLDRETRLLPDNIFNQLTFYCEGVNDGMKQIGRSLPMWATGFQPQPWNQQSVLLVGNLLSFGGLAVSQQQSERLLIELIQSGVDEAKLKDLFGPHVEGVDFELIRQVKMSNQLSDEALELLTDLPRLAGSNAWAVSPQRSASGRALLAADPHLEVHRLPAIWYEICLRWGDRYVMGATLPGCPLFAVARTERLAWGVTYMKGDTSDYFIEECRQAEGTWQYRRGDEWHDFQTRDEIIQRKGGEPLSLCVYENPQGTLDGDPDEAGEGYHLSVSWAGSSEGGGRSIGIWLDLVEARYVTEGMAAVRDCPHPSLVFILADADGHIGRQACGRFPIRREGHSGLLPVPAWEEANHWQGTVATELLPSSYDPPEGFVASANENINPPGGPEFVTLPVPDYRKRRIVERLTELPEATLEDMQRLQYDVISLHARDLLEILLPYLPEGEVRSRLEAWDYNYSPESCEATLFQHLYRNVLLEIFGHEKGIGWRRMLYLCTRVGYSTVVLTSIDRLLAREESTWWPEGEKGERIRRAASRLSMDEARPWSETNAFHFVNRFFEGRVAGHFLGFHTEQMAMPGCHATPFQGHLLTTATRESSFAPSYHFVTDMGTSRAWTNLPGGPSESRFSKYYRNDIPLWISGKYRCIGIGCEDTEQAGE